MTYGKIVCTSPGVYGTWSPSLGPDGSSSDAFTEYRDDIWLAPTHLGQYTDEGPFEFAVRWEFQEPAKEGESNPQYKFEFISADIQGELPEPITITKTGTSINLKSQAPKTADLGPAGNYISYRFIKSTDMYYDISTHIPITQEEFAKQLMHYTGKSWTMRGLNAMTIDGKSFYWTFSIKVKYRRSPTSGLEKWEEFEKSKEFKIGVQPVMTWQKFKERYAECESQESEFWSAI